MRGEGDRLVCAITNNWCNRPLRSQSNSEANETVPAFTPHGRWLEEIQIRPPLGVRFRCAGVLTVCGRIVHFFCAAAAALAYGTDNWGQSAAYRPELLDLDGSSLNGGAQHL
jgi:hypothetical protein